MEHHFLIYLLGTFLKLRKNTFKLESYVFFILLRKLKFWRDERCCEKYYYIRHILTVNWTNLANFKFEFAIIAFCAFGRCHVQKSWKLNEWFSSTYGMTFWKKIITLCTEKKYELLLSGSFKIETYFYIPEQLGSARGKSKQCNKYSFEVIWRSFAGHLFASFCLHSFRKKFLKHR